MIAVVKRFETAVRNGELPVIEQFLLEVEEKQRASLLLKLLKIEIAHRKKVGAVLPRSEYAVRFNAFGSVVDDAFDLEGDSFEYRTQMNVSTHHGIQSGTVVGGKYTLSERIAQGGMGSVWLAKQAEPVKRLVAIKLIKEGMDSRQVIARFDAERQALALMDHPNIAKVFDGGLHDGQPYFVMELVKGLPLTEYCDLHKLTLSQRLELFVGVCQAIQHSHQKGIIHRDIKPTNVLVAVYDDKPVVKVIDFGVAKATGGSLTGLTLDTRIGSIIGTPMYMSPEQATLNNLDIDTRSDVYALGILLYELLTGSTPFSKSSLERQGLMEVLRVVREEDPLRPSDKITTAETLPTLSANRSIDPKKLTGQLRSELDWIVLKAIEKERVRRYDSAQSLSADVLRYLCGEPVTAHPPDILYRLQKISRRYRGQVVAISLVLLALLGGLAGTAVGLIVAQRQRDNAQRLQILADQQKAVAEDNEKLAQKQAELALKNIQFVVRDIDAQLKGRPGMSQIRLGLFEAISKKWDELDVGLTGGVRGQAIPTLMAVRQEMALVFRDLDRLDQAAAEFTKLEKMARERIAVKNGSDTSRGNLARILMTASPLERRRNDPQAGIKKLEEAVALVRSIIKEPNPQDSTAPPSDYQQLMAAVSQTLGVELLHEGRLPETAALFSEALAANTKALEMIRSSEKFAGLDAKGKDAIVVPTEVMLDKSRSGLAYVLLRLGKSEEALPKWRESIANRREGLKRRPDMVMLKSELAGQLKIYGKSLMWLDKLDEAGPNLIESLQVSDEVWQADPEKVDYKRGLAEACYLLANLRERQNRQLEADSLYERSRLLREQIYQQSPDEKNQINLMMSEARLGNLAKTLELSDKLAARATPDGEMYLYRAQALASLIRFSEAAKQSEMTEAALTALEKAVQDGYNDPFCIKSEIELIPLRGNQRFQSALDKLKKN